MNSGGENNVMLHRDSNPRRQASLRVVVRVKVYQRVALGLLLFLPRLLWLRLLFIFPHLLRR
jgi:hypothetical protein